MPYQKIKRITLIITWLAGLGLLPARAQNTKKDEKKSLIELVTRYKQFYDLLNTEASPRTLRKFTNLFSDNVIHIVNDHYDKGSEAFKTGESFIEDCISFFIDNYAVTQKTIQIGDAGATFYGRNNEDYLAWVYKHFEYKYNNQPKIISQWVILTIRREENGGGLKIVAVEKTDRPQDIDNDFIADNYDKCLDTKPDAVANLDGCVEEKKVKPTTVYIPSTNPTYEQYKEPVTEPVARKIRPRPTPPSSRFSIELTGGGITPLPTSFSNQDLLDYKTNTWRDSGALASTVGYTGGIYLQLAITNWLGVGAGYQYVNLPLASKRLMLQIKTFLGNNGVNYDNVSVNSQAYQFHIMYGSLALGSFKNRNKIMKIEPLIGQVNTSFIFPNNLDVQVRYTSGQQQMESLSLKYPSFMIYGAKGTIQWGLDRKGIVRFELQGYYMQGKSDMPSQTIHFTNLPGNIIIPSPYLQLAGINIGFHFTLNSPHK